MFILFIIMMGYHITGNKIHEILGIITFLFFILHHIINIKWYKSIFKGKYNFYRMIQLIINILLFISMTGIIVSSIMISSNVFAFLNIKTTMLGRSIHMVSTSWTFVFMAIHLGLHLNGMLYKLNKKMKSSIFEYVYYMIIILFMLFGLYTFINSGLYKDMFLLNQYKFFDYQESIFMFYLGQFSIICFISFLTYFLIKIKKKSK